MNELLEQSALLSFNEERVMFIEKDIRRLGVVLGDMKPEVEPEPSEEKESSSSGRTSLELNLKMPMN
tara:strand:- start:109 stop:309 length:201 start_codon:yes stop_codon:yes gene_type:complete